MPRFHVEAWLPFRNREMDCYLDAWHIPWYPTKKQYITDVFIVYLHSVGSAGFVLNFDLSSSVHFGLSVKNSSTQGRRFFCRSERICGW